MRNVARILAVIAAVGAAVLVCRLDAAQPAPKKPKAPKTARVCPTVCDSPQSPRRLERPNRAAIVPTVSRGPQDSIYYSPREGVRLVLHACSQHYHCKIENVQACPDQHESDGPTCPPLEDGKWVEIHTAYHAGPAVNPPLPEDLKSCTVGPVVVVGYHAKVTSSQDQPPVPVNFGPPAYEWWGSSTDNDDEDPACKPPAFWHFTQGCKFTVSRSQLNNQFKERKTARRIQAGNRLSCDLTYIPRIGRPISP